MKNNTESKKEATPKTSKAKREPAAKAPKADPEGEAREEVEGGKRTGRPVAVEHR
jgi:hypothetical protein